MADLRRRVDLSFRICTRWGSAAVLLLSVGCARCQVGCPVDYDVFPDGFLGYFAAAGYCSPSYTADGESTRLQVAKPRPTRRVPEPVIASPTPRRRAPQEPVAARTPGQTSPARPAQTDRFSQALRRAVPPPGRLGGDRPTVRLPATNADVPVEATANLPAMPSPIVRIADEVDLLGPDRILQAAANADPREPPPRLTPIRPLPPKSSVRPVISEPRPARFASPYVYAAEADPPKSPTALGELEYDDYWGTDADNRGPGRPAVASIRPPEEVMLMMYPAEDRESLSQPDYYAPAADSADEISIPVRR